MKPKARYQVLSSMMGLDSLIEFRNTLESAKTEYGKRVPNGQCGPTHAAFGNSARALQSEQC